jgi:hypothetical protein
LRSWRAADKAHPEVEPTTHSARVRRDPAVGGVGDSEALEHITRADARLGGGQPVKASDHLEVLAPRKLLVDGRELTRQPDPAAHCQWLSDDIETEYARASGGRAQQRGQHAHERRLAGSVRPSSPNTVPRSTSRSRPSSATTSPKTWRSPSARIAGALCGIT